MHELITFDSAPLTARSVATLAAMTEAVAIREEAEIAKHWVDRRSALERRIEIEVCHDNSEGTWNRTTLRVRIN